MRLKHLTVSGFRGFSGQQEFDLSADVTIVVGANGSGKTSMFDAILWVLTGSIQRLRSDDTADVISRYSVTGEARVELEIDRGGSIVNVVRRFDGTENLSVEDEYGRITSGAAAETALIDIIWPDGLRAPDPGQALSRSLTRAIYLQQDVVREFVEIDDQEIRFDVVGELVGAGRITELQRSLERSRKAWAEATNKQKKDLEPLQSQIKALEDRLRRLSSDASRAEFVPEFDEWLNAVSELIAKDELVDASIRTSEAVDRTISALQARQRQEERRASSLQLLLEHLITPKPEVISTSTLVVQIESTESLASEASEALRLEQQEVASARRRLTEQRDTAESLATLAQLALRHLGDLCPVCNQTYDADATRIRLEELIYEATGPVEISVAQSLPAAERLEELQRQLASEQALLRAAQSSEVAAAQWDLQTNSLAAELGLEVGPNLFEAANLQLADCQSREVTLQSLRDTGERLSLHLALASELVQREEASSQLSELEQNLAQLVAEIDARSETHRLSSDIISALRGASNTIVTEELVRIGPLLQRIYASVDPHPSFRVVDFLTREFRGHGRVWTAVSDPVEGKTVEEPALVLSSSQLNVLAVSTFLALNLAIDSLPLQVVALDDPLQSLDTVNLLGLADLLRRVKDMRQVIVSTHDPRLAQLLTRKLRPSIAGRTCLIRLEAWSRSGPIVNQSYIPADVVPLKLVAS